MPDLLEGTSVTSLQRAAVRALTPKPVPGGRPLPREPDQSHRRRRRCRTTRRTAPGGDGSRSVVSPADLGDRIEVIVRFLALLELFKQGAVDLEQPERFGDIDVVWAPAAGVDTDSILIDAYDG